jgi:hypothetical protein
VGVVVVHSVQNGTLLAAEEGRLMLRSISRPGKGILSEATFGGSA